LYFFFSAHGDYCGLEGYIHAHIYSNKSVKEPQLKYSTPGVECLYKVYNNSTEIKKVKMSFHNKDNPSSFPDLEKLTRNLLKAEMMRVTPWIGTLVGDDSIMRDAWTIFNADQARFTETPKTGSDTSLAVNYEKYFSESLLVHDLRVQPYPERVSLLRNQLEKNQSLFYVVFGNDSLVSQAARLAAVSSECGITLPRVKRNMISMTTIGSHEFGHGVDVGYAISGIDTAAVLRNENSFFPLNQLSDKSLELVHRERLAETFSRFVLQKLLSETVGEPSAETIMVTMETARQNYATRWVEYYQQAKKVGLSVEDVFRELVKKSQKIPYDTELLHKIPGIDITGMSGIHYNLPSYAEDKIKKLTTHIPTD
jgi:hypothetical protein